jgi:hypothetical protein
MTEEIIECYELLGLRPGSPAESVKEAYRDMAKVWHPDRFPNDERLRQKAQDKLKEINAAYERLEGYLAARADAPAEYVDLPMRQSARSTDNQQPPVVLPFPEGLKTLVRAVLIVLCLGVALFTVYVLTWSEATESTSQQGVLMAELETRRLKSELESARKAQAEQMAIAERMKAQAAQRQALAEQRMRELEQARSSGVGSVAESARRAMDQAEQDLATARAEATRAEKLYQLGLQHARGEGVEVNDTEAARLYRAAAEQGHAAAQHYLAFMYGSGRGVPKDLVEAYKWFTLAARNGDLTAYKNLEPFAARMTPDEIEQGRRRAMEFVTRRPDRTATQ